MSILHQFRDYRVGGIANKDTETNLENVSVNWVRNGLS